MSAVAVKKGGSGVGPSSRALRILVVLRAINMDRITEGFLRCALDRGHRVDVALEQSKDRAGRAPGEQSLFDVLEDEYPAFSYEGLPPQDEPWIHPATELRAAIDLLRYYEPEFAEADNLRKRARSRAPWYARIPAGLGLLRVRPIRWLADRFWRAIERRMPVSERSLNLMREFEPDVVVVSPLVEIASPQGDHIRAADRLGIPTVLVVASWDNLTTKGVIRDVPDMTIVWNEDQVREAIELHGVPPERVVATGAHSHDHWFSWKPSTDAEEFARKVGLEPNRPLVLYVCSSGFIAGDDEPEFVREWARRLAESGDPEFASLRVIVRPHPQNFPSWREADLEEAGRIVVWPRGGVAPTDLQSKRDYFDSLYHASAVVGINTTALVDSAIVRRPVFTMVSDHFRSTQTGTLHFSYLARDGGGGLLNVARSWDEHFTQLGAALRASDRHRGQIEGFLQAFVRPHGLDRPAAPLALDAIVETALKEKEPVTERGPLRWLVGATAGALGRLRLLLDDLRPRSIRRRLNRRRKRRAHMARKRGQMRKGAPTRKAARSDRAALKAERAAAKAERSSKTERSAKPPKTARTKSPEKAERAQAKAEAKERAGAERTG
jgi:hypothetical protein